jgi:hypothetical protein
MKTKIIEMTISSHFLTAFINADDSGFSREDIDLMAETIKKYGPYFHVVCPENTETNFERCDISGLFSDCLKCEVEVSNETH